MDIMGTMQEIERVWIARAMPVLPVGAVIWKIQQGYLPEHSVHDQNFREGRIRSVEFVDGSAEYFHTIKQGQGVVRQETEQSLDRAAFERLWPLTQGKRIHKVRHRVTEAGLTWEVDEFLDFPLVMVEVELPSEHAPCDFPQWLAADIVREVSHDPRYRNHALAVHGLPK
jgi:CYTH domain-containing protein